MSGKTLTTNSTLQCPHGGSVQITSSNTQSTAEQGTIVTMADTFMVSGCPYQIPGSPPIPSPCVNVSWILPDVQVKAVSNFVLSDKSVGICMAATGLPQGSVQVTNTQSKVSTR
ncbi:MAG: hypothetical protein AAF431_00345 [Pseudomonadota bacterium]